MTKNTSFQKQCEKAISKLTEEDVDKFKQTTREEERIRLLYECAKSVSITLKNNGKNLELALQNKVQGNKYFATKKYEEALNCYTMGIITCPQDTDGGKELLTILISNRSATYFEQEQYRKVFDDIDYVLSVGSYPQKLQYKIWLRKGKCYAAIQNEKYAEETFNLAISSLKKHSQLDENALSKKIAQILHDKDNFSKETRSAKNNELIPVISNADIFVGGNTEYVAAHKAVFFDYDPLLGRFARADENIQVGVIILEENPHCAVITQDNLTTNCQFCALSTKQPIACPTCAHVVFCSLNCERKANSTFHRIECKILPVLFGSGASINCAMALRMISQKPNGFFQQKKKLLKDFLKDNPKKFPLKSQVYRSDDYITTFFLCRNENRRLKGEIVHYSVMAIYLMRLLKMVGYFVQAQDAILTEEEAFIASLILRHLQILQFNSHEISEIRNTNGEAVDGIPTYYRSECIGAGLYPTLALFNHSCDPSIIRYNTGNRMVVRTIKPIKAGDIIYENYGPLYTTMSVKERRDNLRERYWFDCYCTPCQEEWPLFDKMEANQIKIGCQTQNCPFEFSLYRDDFFPYVQCDYCKTITKIFPLLRGLSQLALLLPKAEELYSAGKHRESAELFMEGLNILYKYSKPPCPDMVKVQQRLKSLFVHLGNKHVNYVLSL